MVEFGLIGIGVFFLLVLQAYLNLRQVYQRAHELPPSEEEEFTQFYFAIIVSGVILMTCALTITMIYTEILWVLLMLPVCLKRALDNHIAEQERHDETG
jgi:O-antigen ligase